MAQQNVGSTFFAMYPNINLPESWSNPALKVIINFYQAKGRRVQVDNIIHGGHHKNLKSRNRIYLITSSYTK